MSKNKAFMFSMGLIAGVVGGIVAGVLYAPKSGEESRKELKEQILYGRIILMVLTVRLCMFTLRQRENVTVNILFQ